MTDIITFEFSGHDVRVVKIDGETHFVGKDVAGQLGYANETDAMSRHCKGVVKRYPLQTPGGIQEMRVLSEPDVLRLIVNSTLPAAEKFERWVFEDVLPTIRKTGGYQQRPLTQAELLQAQATYLVEMERKQAEQAQAVARVEQRVDDLIDYQIMSKRPSNAESITHIRKRMFAKYGIPAHVCDQVMRQLPYSPKPAGMVKNAREEAEGSSYAVYWTKDVSTVFKLFVAECVQETAAFVSHPFIEGRFRLTPGAAGIEGEAA